MKLKHIIIVGLLILTVGLQYRLWLDQEGSFTQISELQDKVERRQAENHSMQQRNEVLKAEIIDLRQGMDAVEEKVRSEFGLIKKGETFYRLVDD